MDYKNIDVKPIAGAIGAEIFGVDLAEEAMAPEVFEEVHTAFLRHCVIFFRDQAMDDDVLARFGRRFGELAPLPPHRQVPGKYPELLIVETKPEDEMVFGWEWHSDTSHLETPTLGSILYAKVLPPAGGDTMFANQYLAYETLSEGMKELLDGLVALHANGRILRTLAEGQTPTPGTVEESQPLLQFLYAHSSKPEFTCRFKWEVNSVAFWDNRCAMHLAMNDYTGYRRLMHRVQVKGTRPV